MTGPWKTCDGYWRPGNRSTGKRIWSSTHRAVPWKRVSRDSKPHCRLISTRRISVDVVATQESQGKMEAVDLQKDPSRYKHWRLSFDAPVATLTMDVAEDGGIRPGYKLKLNSYDLGVDIELHDALQRIRFEHPEIRSVIITSA